jgi:hypothetical protein
MNPDSSASGMNKPGGTMSPACVLQRISASPPVMRPVRKLTFG